MRQQHQAKNVADNSQRSPAEGEPRFAQAAPREAQAERWRSVATKGKQECAYKASSLVNQAKSTPVDRPKGGLMVQIYVRRMQVFLHPKCYTFLIIDVIGMTQMAINTAIRNG
jgi:hypothetical protein